MPKRIFAEIDLVCRETLDIMSYDSLKSYVTDTTPSKSNQRAGSPNKRAPPSGVQCVLPFLRANCL